MTMFGLILSLKYSFRVKLKVLWWWWKYTWWEKYPWFTYHKGLTISRSVIFFITFRMHLRSRHWHWYYPLLRNLFIKENMWLTLVYIHH